jgi:uncharacterized protein YjbI with pentapeptide repeats
MTATFAGKFAFQSTNASGNPWYLTSSVQGSETYPAVLAPALTATEKVIVYAQGDGSFLLALAVPAPVTHAIRLGWFTGQSDLGFVTTAVAVSDARPFRITPFSEVAVAGSWSILDAANNWTPLCYTPNQGMSLLIYDPSDPSAGALQTLLGLCTTPGHNTLAGTKQGQKVDLTYTDLSGLDFTEVDFTGADFTGANLSGTIFHRATLDGAIFTGATMTKTDITGATLDGAIMSGLDLSSVVWGTGISARGTHFEGSLLVGARIGSPSVPANLTNAFFNDADLSRADLTGAQLGSATFYGANLTGITLDWANLTQALFGGSPNDRPTTLAYAQMSNVILTGANLFGGDFTAATLFGAETQINNAATIEQADFSNAYLEGISFAGSNLQGARFDGACLVGADFTGAKLGASAGNTMPASFVGASLPGAIFTRTQLDGVNLANAAISFAAGAFPVRYCTSSGMMPPSPASIPINYQATVGLDLTTLRPTTVCPNGRTLAANQAQGTGLTAMLTAPGAPTGWYAASCLAGPSFLDPVSQ